MRATMCARTPEGTDDLVHQVLQAGGRRGPASAGVLSGSLRGGLRAGSWSAGAVQDGVCGVGSPPSEREAK